MFYLIAIISGMLFGFGMVISGMVDPAVVTAFLDVTGAWRIDLAFVMGGALLVFVPFYYFVIRRQSKPLSSDEFCLPQKKLIDLRLISGASIFGIGWGLAGICPGPAVASISAGSFEIMIFCVALLVGMLATHLFTRN